MTRRSLGWFRTAQLSKGGKNCFRTAWACQVHDLRVLMSVVQQDKVRWCVSAFV